MKSRLQPGDRVRHMIDDVEGIVAAARNGRLPSVVVRLDSGGTIERPQGEWQRLPSHASVSAR